MPPPAWAYQVDSFHPPPDEELVCSICRGVFNDPVRSPCNHVFCRPCITKWLEANRNCPICRKRTYRSDIAEVVPLIRNMINKLTIKCRNRGCGDKFTLEGCETHMKDCIYEMIRCKNKPCQEMILRRDLKEHELVVCSHRYVRCTKCAMKVAPPGDGRHNCVRALQECLKAKMEVIRKKSQKIRELENEVKSLKENNEYRSSSPSSDSSLSSMESHSSSILANAELMLELDHSFPSPTGSNSDIEDMGLPSSANGYTETNSTILMSRNSYSTSRENPTTSDYRYSLPFEAQVSPTGVDDPYDSPDRLSFSTATGSTPFRLLPQRELNPYAIMPSFSAPSDGTSYSTLPANPTARNGTSYAALPANPTANGVPSYVPTSRNGASYSTASDVPSYIPTSRNGASYWTASDFPSYVPTSRSAVDGTSYMTSRSAVDGSSYMTSRSAVDGTSYITSMSAMERASYMPTFDGTNVPPTDARRDGDGFSCGIDIPDDFFSSLAREFSEPDSAASGSDRRPAKRRLPLSTEEMPLGLAAGSSPKRQDSSSHGRSHNDDSGLSQGDFSSRAVEVGSPERLRRSVSYAGLFKHEIPMLSKSTLDMLSKYDTDESDSSEEWLPVGSSADGSLARNGSPAHDGNGSPQGGGDCLVIDVLSADGSLAGSDSEEGSSDDRAGLAQEADQEMSGEEEGESDNEEAESGVEECSSNEEEESDSESAILSDSSMDSPFIDMSPINNFSDDSSESSGAESD